jgi:hypothetical protein
MKFLLAFSLLACAAASLAIPDPSKSTVVECSDDYGKPNEHDGSGGGGFHSECHPKTCKRLEFPSFVDAETIEGLKTIARKAIYVGRQGENVAGPTIVDINAGYLRDMDGLVNIYTEAGSVADATNIFTLDEYALYRDVIERIRSTVSKHFGLPSKYPVFTAPTFITRILYDPAWRPKGVRCC